jgi:glycerol-3-phosphate dehydrogenase
MDLLTLRYVAQVRDHLVVREGDGVVTVTGGKWTTYRKMAEDAVDAAVAEGALTPRRGCVTQRLPLVGAPGCVATLVSSCRAR